MKCVTMIKISNEYKFKGLFINCDELQCVKKARHEYSKFYRQTLKTQLNPQ